MARKERLTFEFVNSVIIYDEHTGLFYRKKSVKQIITKPDKSNGYIKISVGNLQVYAHQLAWLLTHGEWCDGLIDHKNGIKTDNRLSNLKVTDKQGNARNSKLPSDNSSGAIGVCWSKVSNKWRSYITVKGKQHHLGLFEDFEDAVLAREKASIDFNFSSLHGRNNGN